MVRLRRRDKSCFRVGGGSRSLLGLPWKARVSEISEKETRRLGLGRDVLTCVDVFFSFLLFCLLPCDHTERGQKQRWDGRPLLFSPSPLVLYSAWVFFSFCGVFCADSSISFSSSRVLTGQHKIAAAPRHQAQAVRAVGPCQVG